MTRTIEIEERDYTITIEIKRDGLVLEAFMRCQHMEDTPIDVLAAVKESRYYTQKIQEEFENLDWNYKKYWDDPVEYIKDQLKPGRTA